MRAMTVVVSLAEGDPLERLFTDDSRVRRERIYNLTLLEDGTLVLLGRIRGDLAFAREALSAAPGVLESSVSGESARGALVFVHARPPTAVRRLLELPGKHGVFFDLPIEVTDGGRLELVTVGETNAELLAVLEDVPSEIDVTVERIGPYVEDPRALTELLTERQREVLDVALERGYYEVPRRASHREIAAALGVSAPTVSEHLRKAEARIFGAVRGGDRSRGVE
jgi:DNA-binding CsgD family transcriptional regulator